MKEDSRTDLSFENSIEITEVLLAHKCVYRSGEICRVYENGRNFSGFVCPIAGKAIYNASGRPVFTVEPGEILYLPKMSKYTVTGGDRGFSHYTVNFLVSGNKEDSRSNFSHVFGNVPVKTSVENFDEFKRIFSRTVSVFSANLFGSVLFAKAQIYEMMYMFFMENIRTRARNNEYETLMKVKEYIHENYSSNIRAADLSRSFSMSETNLRRKFKEYLGQPPLDYQIGLRIQRSKELLLERQYNVSEVARMVGFDDVNYFSRLFKKKVGVSPVTFEKMY